tara:strand:+ start:1774 stop:2145 length:372 start_codon:yes stop_codon:yes gene_type:complete
MMQDLLTNLQDNPPQTEEELKQVLSETGYDLVPVQPGMGEEEEGFEEEGLEVEEPGGMEEEVEAAEEGPASPVDAMKDLMDMGGGEPKTQGMKMTVMRLGAAKKALDKGKKKNSDEDKGGMYG